MVVKVVSVHGLYIGTYVHAAVWLTPKCAYLRKLLLAEGTLRVVVQTPFQTLETEGVSTGSGDRLIEQPRGDQGEK